MTSQNLEDLLKTGSLKSEPASQGEFNGLLRFAKAGLVDAGNTSLAIERSALRQRNDAIRAKMTVLMNEAAAAGLLRPGPVGRHQMAARAIAYGLGRMYIDGQFPSWESRLP